MFAGAARLHTRRRIQCFAARKRGFMIDADSDADPDVTRLGQAPIRNPERRIRKPVLRSSTFEAFIANFSTVFFPWPASARASMRRPGSSARLGTRPTR
eukprot:15456955-Alexandrium_andersonii.AAC.1